VYFGLELTNIRRVNPYVRLMRLDRPVGSLLLLWPTLAALWMASNGLPDPWLIVIFTLGTFLMRSAGCVINDYADRKIDQAVARTKDRPLATGELSALQAMQLFASLIVASAVLLIFLNQYTQRLAVGGLLVAMLYPFLKRWTYLPQVALGAAFSWGILMAWSATGEGLTSQGILMFLASLLWVLAYDTLYAMVDREDDIKAGIKSTAILFGTLDRLMIGVLHVASLWAFLLLGLQLEYANFYYVGLLATAGLFIHQHWIIRDRDRDACFKAFLNNTWVGLALFLGTLAEISLRPFFG
jgi:4-hydroxybenzoate polyprenyltransferase